MMFGRVVLCAVLMAGIAEAATTMDARIYDSSTTPGLKLSAEFYVPDTPKPLCVFFHGWHMTAEGSAQSGYMRLLAEKFFVVNVDMRGRGPGKGKSVPGVSEKPDASGFELLDALDALDYARRTWPQAVDAKAGMRVIGGSGGGGNTMALIGKAPDLFSAAVSWAGMSDYALWYEGDKRGVYRDEMEKQAWIGGSPASNPEGYRSRGGLNLLENVVTPILVIHGRKDESVPVAHAERYEARAQELGKAMVRLLYNDKGHASEQWPEMIEHLCAHDTPPVLPSEGTLRVHSFLATRAFRLVLDHPSRTGAAGYRLDAQGRLVELSFHQEADAVPVREVALRLFGRRPVISVESRAGRVQPVATARGDGADFHWTCDGPWTVRVTATPE